MATYYVLPGQTSGFTLGSGDVEIVYSGGTDSGTTVEAGGTLIVSGGSSENAMVLPGGTLSIYGGYPSGMITAAVVAGVASVGGATEPSLTIVSGGVLTVGAGAQAFGTVSSGGSAIVQAGGLNIGTVASGAAETVLSGGDAFNAAGGGEVIVSSGGQATIPQAVDLVISPGGKLVTDYSEIQYGIGSESYNSQTDVLTVQAYAHGPGGTRTDEPPVTYQLAATQPAGTFSATTGGDTIVGQENLAFVFVACFAKSTLIATDRGEQPVEHLSPGDVVRTASGRFRPVRWIGFRDVDLSTCIEPERPWPVRVRAGAFGPHMPARDLWLSPEHAVFLHGVLIPVRHLVNDVTITRERRERMSYWHVELDTHDILLAEGLPCESWLDTGNRAMFQNARVADLRPDLSRGAASAWAEAACAPLVQSGRGLAAARRRLARRATAMRLAVCDVTIPPDARVVVAVVPAGATSLRLRSDAGTRPGDGRRLGALIGRINLAGETIALDDRRLGRGFHAVEHIGGAPYRWTDGAAVISLKRADVDRALVLAVADTVGEAASCSTRYHDAPSRPAATA